MSLPETPSLASLLPTAAALDFGDREAGARLRHEAHLVTYRLISAGRLPAHLLVELDDPLVVVVRALAVAARMNGAGIGKDVDRAVGAPA